MDRQRHWLQVLLLIAVFVLFSACQSPAQAVREEGGPEMKAHYVEIVSDSVDRQIKALEQVHGLSFGPEVQDLGRARVAETENGVLVGIRAPLAEHEQPIIRTYFVVDDIAKAVKAAEAAGALVAYPPTKQGETGTWAIYMIDGIQYGLWQQ